MLLWITIENFPLIIIKFPHLVYQKFAEMKEKLHNIAVSDLDCSNTVPRLHIYCLICIIYGRINKKKLACAGMQAALSSIPMSGTFFRGDLFRPKKNICVFQVSRPYLGFCPTLNILL